MKKCPFCAEDIQDAAKVCKHCGRDLVAGLAPKKSSSGCGTFIAVVGLLTLGFCFYSSVFDRKPPEKRPGASDFKPAPAPAPAPPRKGNVANEQLATSSAEKRNAALRATIVSAGDPCTRVKRAFFNGSSKDATAFWSVECSNGRSYMVSIAADATGSTKVLDCGIAGTCFVKF